MWKLDKKLKQLILQKALFVVVGVLFFLGLSIAFRYYAESETESPTAEIIDKE